MLTPSDYIGMDAIELAEGIRNKDFSALEISSCAVEQARRLNPSIGAIVHENYAGALEQAKAIDLHPDILQRSKVAGIPFLIKDLSMVKGLPASFGSRLFDGYIAERDSNIVRKYLDAGLIILGKTNTPEFGLTITTEPQANVPCRNPWNTEYSTGGSSGGAAAAVAAGIIPVAHAADGGGSIRIPAACCGVFGLKPSRGLTTIEDDLAGCWGGLSVGHVVSQTVRDSAAFLDLIKLDKANLFPMPPSPASFYAAHDSTVPQLRIGMQLTHPMQAELDSDCIEGVRASAQLCESLGHNVEEIIHPVDYFSLSAAMSKLINTHVYQSVAQRTDKLGLTLDNCPVEASTRFMAKHGSQISAASYLDATETIRVAERQMAELHRHYDIIISPVLSKIPAKIGWLNMDCDDMKEYTDRFKAYSGFTALYNGTGQPSMSMPLHRSRENIPVGTMFTAAWGADSLLLQLARQLEQSAPWPRLSL